MSTDPSGLRVALYSPDRARTYDGRTREAAGVGGGITARLSMVEALAALGHHVTAYVNCEAPIVHEGVSYVPLDSVSEITCDVLIAISTGGALTLAPLRAVKVEAGLRILWVQGTAPVTDRDAVNADYVYVASNFLRQYCATEWRVPAERLFVCYNGLHQHYFRDAEINPAPRNPHAIAFVGPPEKGLASCVEVVRALRRHDSRFHLDIFGGAALWGRPQEAAPAEPGVTLKGLMGQRDLAQELFKYEYLLALQDIPEGFGIAVQEAKRAGVIAIASAVGAFPELIRHGADGYLVSGAAGSDATQRTAANLILDLSRDPLRRGRIRRRAMTTPWEWHLAAQSWTEEWKRLRESFRPKRETAGVNSPQTGENDARSFQNGRNDSRSRFSDLPDGRHRLSDGAYFPTVYPLSPLPDRLEVAEPPRVVMAGYFGHGNLGDEAILSVALSEWQRARPDVLPIVASGNPDATAAAHDVEAVAEQDLDALGRSVERAEAVVLGGGGIFHDIHGADESTVMTTRHAGIPLCLSLARLASDAGKPLVIQGAGVGPLTSQVGRRLTREVFDAAASATVRDDESASLVRELGAGSSTLAVAADLAYLLESAPREAADEVLAAAGIERDRPIVAVSLRHWTRDIDPAAREAAIAAALDRIVSDEHVAIVFVPLQSGRDRDTDDVAAGERVRRRMTQSSTSLPAGLAPSLVQAVFARCRAVLSMRLHAIILAANARVPFVGLQHESKIAQALRGLGLAGEALELSRVTTDVLAERLREAMRHHDRFTAAFDRNLPALRAAARQAVAIATQAAASGATRATADSLASARDHASAAALSRTAAPPARPSPLPDSMPRRIGRTVVPRSWRRPLRIALEARFLSRAGLAFDSYRRARQRMVGGSIAGVRTPGTAGLVSIVLPVHNGGAMLREAIESILSQSHASFELIVVNDGSTDGSGDVADRFAAEDSRVRVIHQACLRLPTALTNGFAQARGEFLTWASADNRWRPDAIARLADYLRRHADCDVVYANLDLIGENGQPLVGSAHFQSYQRPAGSAHIDLPETTDELNTRDNNFIGAGFLYRRRVASLIGGYSSHRFGVEDYDFWMRANALLNVCKADFSDSVIEYRFHDASLTARAESLGLPAARTRLQVFDQFRRDAALWPIVWVIDPALAGAGELLRRIGEAGHIAYDGTYSLNDAPAPWVPVVCVSISPTFGAERLPAGALKVLIEKEDTPTWLMDDSQSMSASSIGEMFHAIDIRARARLFAEVERLAHTPLSDGPVASVVVCVGGTIATLDPVIAAALQQDFPTDHFEVLVVNNRPADPALAALLRRLPPQVRIIPCPVPGHSAARNAGLGAARGRYVCYLDDDAIPDRGWLAALCRSFEQHPDAGVIGGPILLETPTPTPPAYTAGWAGFWSHFAPPYTEYREAAGRSEYPWGANWAARRDVLFQIGGFRLAFGRRGQDHRGGEEIIAAVTAQRLGHRIGVAPDAIVHHRVDPSRFTTAHVRHTQAARHLVGQAAIRDQIFESDGGLAGRIGRLLLHHVDPAVRAWPHALQDVAYRKAAQWKALQADLADIRRRFQKARRDH